MVHSSKNKILYLYAFVFLSVFIQFAYAQETRQISYFRHLDVKDGLPANDIKEFLVDQQNGYWFRTPNNIIYYNGHDFINYGYGNGIFKIQNKQVESFQISGEYLYVFGDAGIDRIHCQTKKSRQIFSDSSGIGIKHGFITRRKYLLIIDKKGNILQVGADTLKKIGAINAFSNFSVVEETQKKHLLVSNTNRDVVVFSEDLKLLNHIQFPSTVLMKGGIYNVEGYGAFLLYEKKAARYVSDKHQFEVFDTAPKFERLFLKTNRYYYHINGYHKVMQVDVKTQRSINLEINLNTNYYINQIGVDNHNTLVLCTNQGIILYKEPLAIVSYLQTAEDQKKDPVTTRRAIVETHENKIIQVNYRRIDLYDPVTGQNRTISKNDIDGYAALLVGRNLWIGSDGIGLYDMNLRTLKIRSTSGVDNYKNGVSTHVTTISHYKKGILLIGEGMSRSTLKLYTIGTNSYENFRIKGWKQPFLTEKVTAIVDEDDSSKWICSHQGLIQLMNGNQLGLHLAEKELGTDVVHHVYFQSDSIIWIATDRGIIKYHRAKKRVIQRIDESVGLSGNMTISIIPDRYNTVWVPTFTGLSRIGLSTGRIWNYHLQDGFTDNEYNYSSYLKASNGDIYLGGLNGYVRIKPIPPDTAFKNYNTIKLDYALIHKKDGPALLDVDNPGVFEMHKSDDRLSFSFSIMEQLSPEYVKYYYKIDGLHSEWILLGRQNKVELSYLPVGKYKLLVKSGVLQDNYKASHFELPFIVKEYWYETKLFYLLISILLLFSIIGFIYSKYNVVNEINKIRSGLANDIHDEIGTMLTRSIMRLELLRKKGKVDAEVITPVEDHLRETVQSFRNVLWSLNTDNNKTEDFVGRLNVMLQENFGESHFECIVTNLSPNIYFKKSIHVKRNLLLIIKELANNALKYSNGNLFEVVIRSDGRHWKIVIADNGTNKNDQLENRGMGLPSIRKRVEIIGGNITIAKKEKGFYVIINI